MPSEASVKGSAAHAKRYGGGYDDSPSPAVQLRALLAESRADDTAFEQAWAEAFERIAWPSLMREADEWRQVLSSRKVRQCFAAAYARRELPCGPRAVWRLEGAAD